ncbi:M4 family metallopeptidase [Tunicatimonas pelagia]|uniref:M4 family metallopeptidase n=1 Tax=Tunicatimonas pelagia TaxID=931531 RepID=UPI002666AB00|nr:M4 family metallopeptidase [Tunicatimonas pelagia]WKN42607.1 M4 family metallopeptidase [Tunicatimonas pelagia]
MTRILPLLLLFGCLLGSSLLFAQSEAWEVKKQRSQEIQKPSFKYQTRNGAKSKSARQANFMPNLKGSLSSLNLQVRGARGQEPPREIKGELPTANNQAARIATDFPSAANLYLDEVSELMQISAPNDEFVPKQQWTDVRNNRHLRLQQQYQGIDIYGSEIIVHANQRAVQGLNGRYMPTPHLLNTNPSITDTDAIQAALGQLEAVSYLNETQKKLLQYTGPEAKLVILPNWETGTPQLAWQVMARPNMLDYWEIMIDAQSGALIQKTNLTCSFAPEMHLPHGKTDADADAHHHHSAPRQATQSMSPLRLTNASQGSGIDLNNVNQTLNVWQASDGFGLIDASKDIFKSPAGTSIQDLEGVLITYDALSRPEPESVSISFSETNVFADPAAVSAHVNVSIAYDYFRQKHNRLAIDGEGGNILSVVNYVEDDSSGMDNAFWNGTFMVYGNGDVAFRPLAGSLDVGGHEMTHGVINATANLVYRNQSGAINEHIADVFGVLIENEDFLLGEDVVNTQVFPSGALRDMESPHNGGTSLRDNGFQPDHMSEIYTGEEDNGGVHINSGIPNRAFFLIANEIGRDRAGELYYHALTTYLTASSEFSDLRLALLNSANDLFGADAAEIQVVATAFDAVGITEEVGDSNPGGGGDDDGDELPTIAGSEFLLTVNTDEEDQDNAGNMHSLYLVDLANEEFAPISISTVNRKPTITDDGSTAFFITEDETIQGIELSPPFNEQVISDESFWSNLSISKDGNRLAIIPNREMPEIWVIDLTRDTDNVMQFELFNPTTQDGITTGEVQYADAIEWDYSGEFLIYDAFNQVQGFGFGETIEYWDVGAIRVWDNTEDSFGDGSIQKIFTNLPRGTNIGNPSFSKTNRNIICFDLFDTEDETYQIIATDLSTGETNMVFENNTLGFPSYSSDDRFMVFDVIDEDGNPAVGRIALKDKVSSDGELETPYIFAKWTTWFSQGERVINSSEKDILSYEMLLETGNVVGTISNDSIKLVLPEDTDPSTLVARFTASPSSEVFVGEFQQISGISSNDFSQEVDYTVVAQDGSTRTYVVAAEVEQTEDPVTSLDDPLSEKAVVYPNPFEQEIYLPEPLTGNYQLRLSDILGRSYNLAVNQAQIQVKELLAPGVYFLTIQTPKRTQTIRLLRK